MISAGDLVICSVACLGLKQPEAIHLSVEKIQSIAPMPKSLASGRAKK
jgi:hypothetical protein